MVAAPSRRRLWLGDNGIRRINALIRNGVDVNSSIGWKRSAAWRVAAAITQPGHSCMRQSHSSRCAVEWRLRRTSANKNRMRETKGRVTQPSRSGTTVLFRYMEGSKPRAKLIVFVGHRTRSRPSDAKALPSSSPRIPHEVIAQAELSSQPTESVGCRCFQQRDNPRS